MSAPHIAGDIWRDCYIFENENIEAQTIDVGLYHWIKDDETRLIKDDLVPNTDLWWYQRREAAWVSSQVDNNDHLPPVYGRSHVVDIDPYHQKTLEFPITCCVGMEKGAWWDWDDLNLSLYYNYSSNGVSGWTGWTFYENTSHRPYIFIFNASNASGSGHYRFCSILNVNGTIDEFPPGPDAKAAVNISIDAYFNCETKNLYANTATLFNSSGSSTQSVNITSYEWDFGDGCNSSDANPTYNYTDDGVYNVTLTIINDAQQSDNITKTIVVRNKPAEVDFTPGYKVVFVDEQVNFTDNSNDNDGTISQWNWELGDGTNSSLQNTTKSYSTSGFYDISLEVTDDDNDTSKTINYILVIDSLVNQSKTQQNNIWNKIQDAVDNSSSNDIIYIENGTYNEDITINKSIYLIGEDRDNVIISGSVVMSNPCDYEFPDNKSVDLFIPVNMTGNELLLHFNNDSDAGENYATSDWVYDYSGEENNGSKYGPSGAEHDRYSVVIFNRIKIVTMNLKFLNTYYSN